MTVGERIKVLRENIGMSQVDFADKINVSKQTLYKYENNLITNIPSDKIEAAAKLGNISPAYLMGWSDSPDGKGEHKVYAEIKASSKEEAIHIAIKNMLLANGNQYRAENITESEAVALYKASGFDSVQSVEEPTTMAAHFDGTEYTEKELDKIKEFAAFVKSNRNKE